MAKAKDLEEALTNIETKLGGSEKPHMDLGEHLEYIESLIGGSGPSGGNVDDVKVNGISVVEDKTANIQLKTINNTDLQGSGNIIIESGTTVEANPEISGKEDTLTSIKIGDHDYIVSSGSGSSVTPNPEDFVLDEAESLSSIKIDSTNYSVLSPEVVAQHFMMDEVSTIWVDDLQAGTFGGLSYLLQLKLQPGDEDNYPSWPENGFPCLISHYDSDTDTEYVEVAHMCPQGGWEETVEPLDANFDNIQWIEVDIYSSKGFLHLSYTQPTKEGGGWSITENTIVWETGGGSSGSEQSVKGLDFGGKNVLAIKQLVLVDEEDEERYTIYDADSRATDYIPSYIVANGYNEPIITNAFPELAIDSRTGIATAEVTQVVVIKGMGSKSAEMHNTRYHINKMHHYNGLQNYPDNMLFITAVDNISESIDDMALVIFYRENEQ